MEANELRIGNIITADNINLIRVDEIKWVGHQGYIARMNMYRNSPYPSYVDLPLSMANGIPLTEEILTEWCGYRPMYNRWFGAPNNVECDLSKKADKYYLDINCGDNIVGEGIKYLHQLQNLYFALSGEELQIKLPNNYEREISIV